MSNDEPYNAADRRHVRANAKVARLVDRQRTDFVKTIMSTTQGRAWVWDILEAAHIFSISHTGQALNTAFAEGERNIGLRILNDIMAACPDQYVRMAREHNERRAAAATVRPTATEPDSVGPDPVEPDDGPDIYDEYAREIASQQRGV